MVFAMGDTAVFKAVTRRETDKAFLISAQGKEYWLPKSIMKRRLRMANQPVGNVVDEYEVDAWWVHKNKLDCGCDKQYVERC